MFLTLVPEVDDMIMLCERCCAPIHESEALLRRAHVDHSEPDGTIVWNHSYTHATACSAPLADTESWGSARRR